ncbi:hypothetical protein [Actinomadura violacea]|uniref:Uncharacterized protein n=1 Tax=Actinomadura violacea TaxID=2819934 RepID=A0ABS3RY61_9ACTN|nr:hypothetical protein [Actinomadura violacea]MBO2461698.1 hypothetical protein [Actinomadura violacea]
MRNTHSVMDDMLAAHGGDLDRLLNVAQANVAALAEVLQDAVDAPETVSAAVFARILTDTSTELKWVAAHVTNGMPPQAPSAA